jgi:signal transduction histidine kinase
LVVESPLLPDEKLLRALAEFAAGAGHEINNPLATIVGHAQLLLRDETYPDRRLSLETIGGQALRVRDMIGDLMLFARPPVPQKQADDLASATREAVAKLGQEAGTRRVRFSVETPESAPLMADRTQLRIVIAELVRNALEACASRGAPPGDAPAGTVQVVVSPTSGDVGTGWNLDVIDDGPGLSNLDREHAFNPFYSGREAGRGLGFGLCKCWRIVSSHGGTLTLLTPEEGGVMARAVWPGTALRA